MIKSEDITNTFAGIRVSGRLIDKFITKNNMDGNDVVDISISKEEAERIIKFLNYCFEKEGNKNG